MPTLFDPIHFGSIESANRIVMAPLTRDRAGPHQVPTPLMACYYGQRASAGLIVSEATQISAEGQGYLDTLRADTALRSGFKNGNSQGAWIVNNGYTRNMALEAVASGAADMVAFGKPFISNPDLVSRLRAGARLASLKTATLYGG